MATDDTVALRVIIVGGGITGLLIAQGLKKIGFKVVVYERDAHLTARETDWTMSLHWSLPNLQQLLPSSILSDISFAYTDQHMSYDTPQPPIPFYNGVTGSILHHVPAPNLRRLSRARFRELCARDLDIRWGRKLTDMSVPEDDGPVTLHFEDTAGITKEVMADLVIGADGTNSKVRRLLLGEEAGAAQTSEWSMYNGVACYNDAAKALFVRESHPLCTLAFTEHGLAFCGIQSVPLPSSSTWSFNILRFVRGTTTPLTSNAVISHLKSISQSLSEPFRSAIAWIPEGSNFFATPLKYWVSTPWNGRGKVALAGDAAHAMLPARGQGMNHALEDAGRLVALMEGVRKRGKGKLGDVLGDYEREVVERGRDAVLRSLEDCEANTRVGESGRTRIARKGLDA